MFRHHVFMLKCKQVKVNSASGQSSHTALDWMLIHHRVTPGVKFTSTCTYSYSWVERQCQSWVSFPKKHNITTMSRTLNCPEHLPNMNIESTVTGNKSFISSYHNHSIDGTILWHIYEVHFGFLDGIQVCASDAQLEASTTIKQIMVKQLASGWTASGWVIHEEKSDSFQFVCFSNMRKEKPVH